MNSQISTLETPSGSQEPVGEFETSLGGRERLLRACHCLPVDRPPVWLMRQAGRALPEYRKLKERRSFIELVKTPELAAEVTLQPIRRFGFDAAILFSDILVVPEALGQPYRFRDGGGIEMDFSIRTAEDIARLDCARVVDRLAYVADALEIIGNELNAETGLLGFAGSPWTLANYMIHGGSGREQTGARILLHTEPALFARLMEKLTFAVTEFLKLQITAGVDAVQIFDSCGGLLAENDFEEGSARWMRQIIAGIDGETPVIVFSKGVHGNWPALVNTGANVLGVDWTMDLPRLAAALPEQVAVQGNLDPALLTTEPEIVALESGRLLQAMANRPGHIFNLGHGVPPDARLECIWALIDTVRDIGWS
ncbi:MAG TPA: uroporphyrinogen decarboxylase [Chthoniobacteraceae bacterium]|nr:uroporphyrinogen decarboxylase [Chthoniobacteraceae bacterium]